MPWISAVCYHASMRKANYHTHSTLDDGKSTPREMVEAAIASGFEILGFSAHAPLPFDAPWTLKTENVEGYFREITSLAAEYRERITILRGMEIDWLPPVLRPDDSYFSGLPLDYKLGAVHFVVLDDGKPFPVDESEDEFSVGFSRYFGNDGSRLTRKYYDAYSAMIEAGGFDLAGHFDLIKKNNINASIFDESSGKYRKMALACADLFAERDMVVEVNTGGLARKKVDSIYPSPFILKHMKSRSIPVTVSADAHHVDHLKGYHEAACAVLFECGYREIHILENNKWKTTPLD